MLVNTRVDENIDDIKLNIRKTISLISETTNPETWGYNDLSKEFLNKLIDIQHQLQKIYISLED